MRRHFLSAAFAAASLLPSFGSAAHADWTIVTAQTVSGMPWGVVNALGKQFRDPFYAKTTSIKGKRSRVESGNRVILCGIDSSGTIAVLDSRTRTYYLTTGAEEFDRDRPLYRAQIAKMMKSVKYFIHPIAGTRKIVGFKASGVQAQFSLDVKVTDFDNNQTLTVHFVIDEEDWISSKVPEVPTNISDADYNSYLGSAFGSNFVSMLKRSMPLKPGEYIPDGASLISTAVFHITVPGDTSVEIKQQIPPTFTIREAIVSISHDIVADTQFDIPSGYRKVLVPVRPPATEQSKSAVVSASSPNVRTSLRVFGQ